MAHAGQATASLKPNDRVRAGDEITTLSGSAALLRLSDGSTVEVFPASRVVFQDASHSVWKNFLEVVIGTVKIHVEKLSGRPNPKSVTTPTAIIAVRGTIFDVRVDQEATTRVGVEEGLVSVASFNLSMPGQQPEVMLQPGYQTTVERGQPPSQPQIRQQDQSAPASRFGPGGPGNSPGPGGPGQQGPGQGQQGQGVGSRPQSISPPPPPRRPGNE
jgi:ferric-dicitrate binding protein FerR (iron transport regulator)